MGLWFLGFTQISLFVVFWAHTDPAVCGFWARTDLAVCGFWAHTDLTDLTEFFVGGFWLTQISRISLNCIDDGKSHRIVWLESGGGF